MSKYENILVTFGCQGTSKDSLGKRNDL